ncbi:uncharacterized protein KRP23_11031 [Phytophthora ramorum]|uniref:uncharacterized protein n=1 Tax=Phytophthora ramorum TaxID=164328 RepID=UPI0030ADEDF6|nr:hypothetical protein KRP23_11031 [Phytophthora ramorum]
MGLSLSADGAIVVQNRSHVVSSETHRQFRDLNNFLHVHRAVLYEILHQDPLFPGRFILYGEWLAATHSIAYSRLGSLFYAFDLYDRESGQFWDRSSLQELLAVSAASCPGLKSIQLVPKLWEGRMLPPRDELVTMAQQRRSQFYNGPVEGVYIKWERLGRVNERSKIVRSNFMAGDAHWSHHAIHFNHVNEHHFRSASCCLACYEPAGALVRASSSVLTASAAPSRAAVRRQLLAASCFALEHVDGNSNACIGRQEGSRLRSWRPQALFDFEEWESIIGTETVHDARNRGHCDGEDILKKISPRTVLNEEKFVHDVMSSHIMCIHPSTTVIDALATMTRRTSGTWQCERRHDERCQAWFGSLLQIEDPLEKCWDLAATSNCRHFPVIGVMRQDREKELAGILSIKDIVREIPRITTPARFPPHGVLEV